MTAPELPDLDELAVRLVQVRHQVAELARRLEKAEERAAQFPSDFARRTLAALREEDAACRAEIAQLEEQLRPVLRRAEPQ